MAMAIVIRSQSHTSQRSSMIYRHVLMLCEVIRYLRVDSAGFTYRLYRLKPRASRSKGASKKLVRIVNGRYMII